MGTIPSDFWFLANLVMLSLQDNRLFGTLPELIVGSMLTVVDFARNLNLNGTLPAKWGQTGVADDGGCQCQSNHRIVTS